MPERLGTTSHAIAWLVVQPVPMKANEVPEPAELVLHLAGKDYPTGMKGSPEAIARAVAAIPLAVGALLDEAKPTTEE